MKTEWIFDIFFIFGLAGLGAGVYDNFGRGWALIAVSFILLAIAIYGTVNRDP